jgi:hypothetical protein
VYMPPSKTPERPPRQTIGLRPTRARGGVAFHNSYNVGSPIVLISRLDHAARTLAVYASQRPSPDATQFCRSAGIAGSASGWWSTFAGRGSYPQGSIVRFRPWLRHDVPLTQAWPGAQESQSRSTVKRNRQIA